MSTVRKYRKDLLVLVRDWEVPFSPNESELTIRLIATGPERDERDPFQKSRTLLIHGVLGYGTGCLHSLSPLDRIARASDS